MVPWVGEPLSDHSYELVQRRQVCRDEETILVDFRYSKIHQTTQELYASLLRLHFYLHLDNVVDLILGGLLGLLDQNVVALGNTSGIRPVGGKTGL